MSATVFSQDTESKKCIKISTLNSIVKESKKCDSLRVRYMEKSILLDSLVQSNLSIFAELNEQREYRLKIEAKLEKNQKDQLKQAKKNKKLPIWIASSAVVGLVIGVVISK